MRRILATAVAAVVATSAITGALLPVTAAPEQALTVTASPETGCRATPSQFFSTIGTRNVTVDFVPGCEPHFEFSGPSSGAQLVGRFQNDALGYMWWFVWPEDAAKPITHWQLRQSSTKPAP